MLAKLKRNDELLTFWCPGCDDSHTIQHGSDIGPNWDWNGDMIKPTFTPSVLVQGVKKITDEQHAAFMAGGELPEPVPLVCHSFVTDGRIQFLGDCTHALAGQTVDLPPWPTEEA